MNFSNHCYCNNYCNTLPLNTLYVRALILFFRNRPVESFREFLRFPFFPFWSINCTRVIWYIQTLRKTLTIESVSRYYAISFYLRVEIRIVYLRFENTISVWRPKGELGLWNFLDALHLAKHSMQIYMQIQRTRWGR